MERARCDDDCGNYNVTERVCVCVCACVFKKSLTCLHVCTLNLQCGLCLCVCLCLFLSIFLSVSVSISFLSLSLSLSLSLWCDLPLLFLSASSSVAWSLRSHHLVTPLKELICPFLRCKRFFLLNLGKNSTFLSRSLAWTGAQPGPDLVLILSIREKMLSSFCEIFLSPST